MPSDQAICFCVRSPAPAGSQPAAWVTELAGRFEGGSRVHRLGSWAELRPADVADCDLIALLDEASEPSPGWLDRLQELPAELDVITPAARGPSGRPAGAAAADEGTVLRAYVFQSVGLEADARESFVERCRRFGFRVGGQERVEPSGSPLPAASVASAPPLGLNLFGFLSGNLGLGVAARHYLRGFLDAGIPVHPVDIQVGGGRAGHDNRFRDISASLNDPAPHLVNLYVVNPPDLITLRAAGFPAIEFEDRINICIPFWELPHIPASWLSALDDVDLVFAATRFIQYSLLAQLAGPRVEHLPVPLKLEPGVSEDRRRFGLSESAVIFSSSFEMASDMNRKNPYAAIEAFKRAFTPADDVLLVIKVNNASMEDSFHAHMCSLCAITSNNPRILIYDEILSYADVLSLYACSDVFVSLHRAEGLGLGMLEAMHLGKPVIATAWSGNMDYMNERNACLVGYDFVPVKASTQAAYSAEFLGEGARWAEPHLEEAADWMRRLADDAELRRALGKQAAADMGARSLATGEDELLAAVRNAATRRGIHLR